MTGVRPRSKLKMADVKIILDDFRLSYLFDIEDPIPESRLANELESQDFKVVRQRYIVAPPLRAVLLNMASHRGTSVIYQKETIPAFIGVAGKDVLEVKKSFDKLQHVLGRIDSTILDRSTGVEMVTTTKVFSRKLPEETIPSLASRKIDLFQNLIGGTPKLFTAQVASEAEDKRWFVRIEPLLRSPKYYFITLTYQDSKPDMAKVIDLADRSEKMIEQIIDIVES